VGIIPSLGSKRFSHVFRLATYWVHCCSFYFKSIKMKKLESWSDVLDVWVSKWAVYKNKKVNLPDRWIEYDNWRVWLYHKQDTIYDSEILETIMTNIYEILYSPESNFFEVMFPRNILARVDCVISKDPLQYLIDNINETLSYQ